MKKILLAFSISAFLISCSKDSTTSSNNSSSTTSDTIRYIIKTTSAKNWNGYFFDETNQKILISNQTNSVEIKFINKAQKPRALEISATTVANNSTDSFSIETKIYSNSNFIGTYFIVGVGNNPETSTSKATLN